MHGVLFCHFDFCEVDGTFMGKFMAKFWQGLAGLWQNYIQAVVELWQRSGKNMAEFMARGWQIYGKVTATSVPMLSQSFGQVVSRIWQRYDEVMAKFGEVMVKLWFRYGKVYGKAMAELWQRDSEVMVK